MSEQVNHPSHYCQEGKKECIEQMREDYRDLVTLIFCLTNAYKYLYRAGAKEGNSKEQDIAKAKWYYDYSKKLWFRTPDLVLARSIEFLTDYIKENLGENE